MCSFRLITGECEFNCATGSHLNENKHTLYAERYGDFENTF
jgi:hypothetical protein